MNWNEVIIVTSTEAVEATANLFMEAGAKGTVVEDEMDYFLLQDDGTGQLKEQREKPKTDRDVLVKAYFISNDSFADTLRTIKEKMNQMRQVDLELGKYALLVNDVKEEDWENSWKQYYHPIRITRYLTIVPFWETYEKEQPDEKLIVMDPGMAFGTGTHPTTRLSLEALEATLRGGEKVLDVGTGSGVLSIAAKALGAKEVQAFDIDEIATRQSKANLAKNVYAKDVVVKENNLLAGIHNAEADVIVANILAEILLLMIDDAWSNLKEGGTFILSGIINSKKQELEEALQQKGFLIEQVKTMGDWHCLLCKKNTEDVSCSDI